MNSTVKRLDFEATIQANHQISPGFFKMTLEHRANDLRFAPGQFLQLQISAQGLTPLLRRPFAPSEVKQDQFSFVYAVVGEGTEAMSHLRYGCTVNILAPLGTSYTLPSAEESAILVGGGCGTPSLRYFAQHLHTKGIRVYSVVGARTSCALLEINALRDHSIRVMTATDDGSEGHKGNAVEAVATIVEELQHEQIRLYACGPHMMLKALAAYAKQTDIPCEVSLEERMACGFGACMGCAVKVKANNDEGYIFKRVCHDGPIFNAEALIWE